MTDALVARIADAPYARALGLRVEDVTPQAARVRVPYADSNSNPGRALHGGVAASTIGMAGALVAWSGGSAGPNLDAGTLDLSVSYLAAAIGEDIVADARVLRRGKEITYADVDVRTDAGKAIARGLVTYRATAAGPPERERSWTPAPVRSPDVSELPQLARLFVSVPFIARLGISVAAAADGVAIARLPFAGENADADGAVHEGALAALLDTTGALASWSLAGPDLRAKASTVGIHVNFHGRARDETVVAHARTLTRRDESFLNAVIVRGAASGRLVATGSVTYRIVLP
jgi:uncharacterized protein (TIGR00369 family)